MGSALTRLAPPPAPDLPGDHIPHTEAGGVGHGQRLRLALEALEHFPALMESRTRLLVAVAAARVKVADVVAVVASDLALTVAVMRRANRLPGRPPSTVETIVDAVNLLTPEAVAEVARRARTFDFIEPSTVWDATPERVRLHGLATRTTAAGLLRLADMLAHYALDGDVSPAEMRKAARKLGIGSGQLRAVMCDLPDELAAGRRRATEPCPLSRREMDVLRGLAEGKVYKQIALNLGLSASTVRSHLHNAYGKLGAADPRPGRPHRHRERLARLPRGRAGRPAAAARSPDLDPVSVGRAPRAGTGSPPPPPCRRRGARRSTPRATPPTPRPARAAPGRRSTSGDAAPSRPRPLRPSRARGRAYAR